MNRINNEIQKLIDGTDYWDAEILDLNASYFGLIKFIRFILSDFQQPTTPACLLINHHGCCKTINHPRF